MAPAKYPAFCLGPDALNQNVIEIIVCGHVVGPIVLTWIEFNPSMDKLSYVQQNVEWNYLFIPKLQRCKRWSLRLDK